MKKNELDTPVAVIDLDAMENNISSMANFTDDLGIDLRPHIKTHKVNEIARMQLEAGAVGLTCAKIGEAEVMADEAGAEDIFIANLIVGDDKIRRLLDLAERVKMSVGVDSIENLFGGVMQNLKWYALSSFIGIMIYLTLIYIGYMQNILF